MLAGRTWVGTLLRRWAPTVTPARTLAATVTTRWAATTGPARWTAGVLMQSFPDVTTELLLVQVTVTPPKDLTSPALAVRLALVDPDPKSPLGSVAPTSGDWHAATWAAGLTNTAQLLIGAGITGLAFPAGTVKVAWFEVTDGSEIVRRPADVVRFV